MNYVMESRLAVLQDRNFLKKIFTQSEVYLKKKEEIESYGRKKWETGRKQYEGLRYIVVFKGGSSGKVVLGK